MTTFEIEVARCTVASRYLGSVLLLMPTVWVSSTLAAPPVDPLPPPTYSFSRVSPTVEAGFVTADACLVLNQPVPDIGVEGAVLGFGLPNDDLDALASDNIVLDGEDLFALLFSVDAATLGVVGPDSDLVEEGVPFNTRHQAARGQQAGDQFMSTTLYKLDDGEDTGLPNNVLVRNNYDEGGVDFAALPPTSARQRGFAQAQDEVDATARFSTEMVYYSATGDSPSLSTLPFLNEPSGAHILAAIPSQNQVFLFASFSDLGLQQEDDIDALIVFDTDADGVFSASDRVLFSLAPGSPSLTTIPEASESGAAADVYIVSVDEAPALFASAAALGLGSSADNIDALELLMCDDYEDCAEDHGIQGAGGQWDGDEDDDDEMESGDHTPQLREEED